MNWTSPFFLVLVTGGLVFVIAGWILRRWPPESINGTYGYRTPRSRKSQAAWDLSQPLAGRRMMQAGVVEMFVSSAGLFFSLPDLVEVGAALGVTILLSVLLYLSVEAALKTQV